MDPVFAGKEPGLAFMLKFNSWPAFEPPANPLRVGFQNNGFQSPIGQMNSGHQPGNAAANDKRRIGWEVFH